MPNHNLWKPDRNGPLRARLLEIAEERPRLGHPMLHLTLRREGWNVNHKRTERLYRLEKLSLRRRKRRRKLRGVRVVFAATKRVNERWWTLRFALALTYFNAGFAKSNGIDWWTGDAVWRAVNLPEFRQFDVFWLGLYPWCFKLAAWGTLFFECFYPVAILSRRVRFFWIPVIVCMHIGISVGLGLHFFAFAMILFNLSLFSWTDFKGFKPKIFSQDESPFKCREAPFSEHDDVSQIVGNKN